MTEKTLKNLSRKQLLELLLKQTERADALQAQLEQAQQQLEDKTLTETEAGSIAEAALKLNGVFEAAQAAAEQYLDNIRRCSEQAEQIAADRARDMLLDAQQRCEEMEQEGERRLEERQRMLEQEYRQKRLLEQVLQENG